jgi:hypothetical protein
MKRPPVSSETGLSSVHLVRLVCGNGLTAPTRFGHPFVRAIYVRYGHARGGSLGYQSGPYMRFWNVWLERK